MIIYFHVISFSVYDDVPEALKTWKKEGKKIFIYSSGSVAAQKLLFKYSKFGDLDSVSTISKFCLFKSHPKLFIPIDIFFS